MHLEKTVESAKRVCDRTAVDAELLGVRLLQIGEARVFDFGVKRPGTLAGGLRLAEVCLAGLASVKIQPPSITDLNLPIVSVSTDWPLAACIASQYAGWPFSHEKYFAMCSGTARLNRGREDILSHHQLTGQYSPAIGVFETDSLPSDAEIRAFAAECKVDPGQVILCVASTASFAGTLQVVARTIETAMHKLHELKFDLTTIQSAFGTAPLPPIPPRDLTALGWTNDAILYGGRVHLWVDTTDQAIDQVIDLLPSCSSSDFGEPFQTTFERYQRDFYRIDKRLFSPAQVIINNLSTGHVFRGGELRADILKESYGL